MTINRRSLCSGFTLLEVVVALFIVAMIMTLTYGVLRQLLSAEERYALRAQQLRNQLVIQRTLVTDFASALPDEAVALRFEESALDMRLTGAVFPSLSLGAEVDVRYQWSQQGGTLTWSRGFVDPSSRQPFPGWQFSLSDGLEKVRYQLRVVDQWVDSDAYIQGEVRAVRWFFQWSEIGEWSVVAPLPETLW